MIKEITVKEPITYEHPPDGGHLPIIDPYDGCSLRCPYCFQQSDQEWNKDLYVKTNIDQLIKAKLADWDRGRVIYIGSRCDPYMPIEKRYGLTRKCLIELNELAIPCMIVTKSDSEIIFRDMDILSNYRADFTLLLGLSNLNQLRLSKNSWEIKNIDMANKIHRMGIKVWTFITPILPGITDVIRMMENLDSEIPVFLDKVRLEKESNPAKSMLAFIEKNYPDLKQVYEEIIFHDNDPYCEMLKSSLKSEPRVKFVFD
jgi:DNA repair photolyase